MSLVNSRERALPSFGTTTDVPPRSSVLIIAFIAVFMLLAIVWASFAEVDELSRAEGRVIPSGKTQVVQSAEAGVVAEILVRPGQQVKRGQQLIRLDDTSITSSAGEVEARVRALDVQVVRLRLEYTGSPVTDFVCPESIAAFAPEICENEINLVAARAFSLEQNKDVLRQRVEQRRRELSEAEANRTRIEEGLVLARQSHDLMAPLAEQGLVARTTFIAAQRELSDLEGQREANVELMARLQAGLEEAQLQVAQAETLFRQEALAEMTVKLAELSSLRQQLRGAADRVERTDIRSPVDGIINSLEVNTIGAVVQPGTRILDIVPATDTLVVEARLNPADVAFVLPGQEANIKLTAYDFSIFGGLTGVAQNVSADSILDPDTRETYYSVLISTDGQGLEYRGEFLPIMPGMVTSVEIITGKKTILQYLLKPINKARTEALSER
jgi:membrane fusion protein, adhesin transport system